jgi:heme exporter protein C
MNNRLVPSRQRAAVLSGIVVVLLASSLYLIFFVAPTEATMGHVQRILYVHVAVAWCGLAGCVAMAFCGAAYLIQRRLSWDYWSQASGELGWLCATLTLLTGSAWAHEAWGTWWTWEPRLTSMLLLWILYAGIVLVRSNIDDVRRRGRISAALALISVCDVPLIFMATRWFRGVHPVVPEMDGTMRLVLMTSVISFSAVSALLVLHRQRLLASGDRVAALEAAAWRGDASLR